MHEVKLGRNVWALVAMVSAASQARADDDLKMEVATTSMSIAAPELQVLIRNEGDKVDSYKVKIRGAKQGSVPACDLARDAQDDSQPGHAAREQLTRGISGSIAPHGFAHRIHAFRGLPTSPCSVEVKLSSTRATQKEIVKISSTVGTVKPTTIEPKITAHGWAEQDILDRVLLVHVIARNNSELPQTLAILRREISCKEPSSIFWSLLRDVPQGLPSGPAVVPGRAWIGFVSAIEVPALHQDMRCTAFFDVAYERTPRGFAVIERVEVPLQEDSRWTWPAPDAKWPE